MPLEAFIALSGAAMMRLACDACGMQGAAPLPRNVMPDRASAELERARRVHVDLGWTFEANTARCPRCNGAPLMGAGAGQEGVARAFHLGEDTGGKCELVAGEWVLPGWMCCACRTQWGYATYNGEARDVCKACGHRRCGQAARAPAAPSIVLAGGH